MPDAEDRKFDEVVLGSAELSACSPFLDEFDVEFRGLKINAPKRVTAVRSKGEEGLSPETRIPVCISLQLGASEVAENPAPLTSISLQLEDPATGESFHGLLGASRPSRPLPPENPPPAGSVEAARRFYYNVNAAQYVALPARSTTYVVTAKMGPYESNSLRVELR